MSPDARFSFSAITLANRTFSSLLLRRVFQQSECGHEHFGHPDRKGAEHSVCQKRSLSASHRNDTVHFSSADKLLKIRSRLPGKHLHPFFFGRTLCASACWGLCRPVIGHDADRITRPHVYRYHADLKVSQTFHQILKLLAFCIKSPKDCHSLLHSHSPIRRPPAAAIPFFRSRKQIFYEAQCFSSRQIHLRLIRMIRHVPPDSAAVSQLAA